MAFEWSHHRGDNVEGVGLPSGEPCDCCGPGCLCGDCPECMGETPHPPQGPDPPDEED